MGAILGHLAIEGRTHLRGFARDLGLAFQIVDDIMDVEGDEAVAGKALHKDAAAGKATFVSLMGLERAKADRAQGFGRNKRVNHLCGRYGHEAGLAPCDCPLCSGAGSVMGDK